MNFLQRRRARFLIKRAPPFADESLVAVANFTWVGNSMGAAGDAWPRRLGWRAAGLDADRSGGDSALVGSWPLPQVRLNETELSAQRRSGEVRGRARNTFRPRSR